MDWEQRLTALLQGVEETLTAAGSNKRPRARREDAERVLSDNVYPSLRATLEELTTQTLSHDHEVPVANGSGFDGSVVHYTGLDVLLSILGGPDEPPEEKFLWLTDTVYSNDPGEGRFLLSNIEKGYPVVFSERSPSVYVTSFINSRRDSRTQDDLIFWREYGREGQGCSIKVQSPSFLSTDRQPDVDDQNYLRVHPVVYQKSKVDQLANKIEEVLKTIKSLLEFNWPAISVQKNDVLDRIKNEFWDSLGPLPYLYKSDAYQHERELRVIMCADNDIRRKEDIKFSWSATNGDMKIRRYVKHPALSAKSIIKSGTKITIGPTVQHPGHVLACIIDLLAQKNMHGVDVERSMIDYRRR